MSVRTGEGRKPPRESALRDVRRDGTIVGIDTTIAEIPMRRSHAHSRSTTRRQSVVIVELRTACGAVGIGEGATPGGPWWSGDSAETIKVVIDRYLSPALEGQSVFAIETALARMDLAAARNNFAKAAVDTAMHDAAARILGIPLAELLGGRVRERIEVLWALGIGRTDDDVAEARAMLEERRHRVFKIKIGAGDPKADVRRACETAAAIGARSRVDLNQAWSETQAMRWLPELEAAGIELAEAPVDGRNLEAMRRLADRLDMPIMADEGLWDYVDAYEHVRRGATDVLDVKVGKGGGIRRAAKLAAVGEAAGVGLWGGMALETSIGTAAALQLFSTFGTLEWGCETIGPLMLADDLATEPIHYGEFAVSVPDGVGIGVDLDREKLAHYARR